MLKLWCVIMRIFCIWSQYSFVVGVQAGSIGNRVSLFSAFVLFYFWKGTIKISCHKLREFYPLLFSQPVDKCTFENETKSAWVVIIWFKFQHTHMQSVASFVSIQWNLFHFFSSLSCLPSQPCKNACKRFQLTSFSPPSHSLFMKYVVKVNYFMLLNGYPFMASDNS